MRLGTAWTRGDALVVTITSAVSLVALAVNSAYAAFSSAAIRLLSPWVLSGAVVILITQSVCLKWRRERPILVFVAVFLGFVALLMLQENRDLTVSPALWVAAFFVAEHTAPRTALITLAIGSAAYIVAQSALVLSESFVAAEDWLFITSVYLTRALSTFTVCGFLGAWVALQRRRAELALEHSRLVREEGEARVREAIARERTAMARELHDVAAHHLSGIAIQSRAALLVHADEPETVRQLLSDIRRQSQATLTSLREVVGILRTHEAPGRVPAPTLDGVHELVASFRALGMRIEFDMSHEAPSSPSTLSPTTSPALPATVEHASYRFVQESLANAQHHAPGAHVAVRITTTPEKLTLQVANGPAECHDTHPGAEQEGFGLLGMRERVRLLGGTFVANPREGGGWENTAVIPLQNERVAA